MEEELRTCNICGSPCFHNIELGVWECDNCNFAFDDDEEDMSAGRYDEDGEYVEDLSEE